jgi:glutaredoxin
MKIPATSHGYVLVSKLGCFNCEKARCYLEDIGEGYVYQNIEEGVDRGEFLRRVDELERVTGTRRFPMVFYNGEYVCSIDPKLGFRN